MDTEHYIRKLGCIKMGSFIPGIQMDADADEHRPERKMVPAADFQMLQAVVIQYTVIETLTGGTLFVYGLVFFGIPRDAGLEAEVSMVFYVAGAAIAAGADVFQQAGSGIYAHPLPGHFPMGTFYALQRRAGGPACRKLRLQGHFQGFCPAVDIDEGIDIPPFQQFVGRDIAVCGI